jgi:hypothetical protein
VKQDYTNLGPAMQAARAVTDPEGMRAAADLLGIRQGPAGPPR